jgi:hypothetical protein
MKQSIGHAASNGQKPHEAEGLPGAHYTYQPASHIAATSTTCATNVRIICILYDFVMLSVECCCWKLNFPFSFPSHLVHNGLYAILSFPGLYRQEESRYSTSVFLQYVCRM